MLTTTPRTHGQGHAEQCARSGGRPGSQRAAWSDAVPDDRVSREYTSAGPCLSVARDTGSSSADARTGGDVRTKYASNVQARGDKAATPAPCGGVERRITMVAQETSFEEDLIASLEQALAHTRGEAPAVAPSQRQARFFALRSARTAGGATLPRPRRQSGRRPRW